MTDVLWGFIPEPTKKDLGKRIVVGFLRGFPKDDTDLVEKTKVTSAWCRELGAMGDITYVWSWENHIPMIGEDTILWFMDFPELVDDAKKEQTPAEAA